MAQTFSLVLSVISLVTSIVSAIIVYQQKRISRQTNMLPILVDMFKEFRSFEFKRHQFYIYNQLRQECKPEETGFRNLPEAAASHVLPVSHYFDNLGVLVAMGVVDMKVVLGFVGGSIESTWAALKPYILRERELRASTYQEHFEHLAALAQANPQSRVVQKMKLKKLQE